MGEAARLRVTQHGWGTLVELAGPEVRNALDPAAVAALCDVFAGDGPGAVVLASVGDVFCSGGDLSVLREAAEAGRLEELLAEGARSFGSLIEAIVSCPRPVVAAVRGAAVGGGLALALACDVRIAGRSTRLVPGWGRWGLPPDGGASALLALALGPAAAAAALVLGDDLPATGPLGPLLFHRVVDDEAVLGVAVETAERICAHAGARSAKAVTRPLLLPLLRQTEVELAALLAAAREPAVAARLTGAAS